MYSIKEHFRCIIDAVVPMIYEHDLRFLCSFLIKIDIFLFNTAAITSFNTFILIEALMAQVTQIKQIIYAFESTSSDLNMHQKI